MAEPSNREMFDFQQRVNDQELRAKALSASTVLHPSSEQEMLKSAEAFYNFLKGE